MWSQVFPLCVQAWRSWNTGYFTKGHLSYFASKTGSKPIREIISHIGFRILASQAIFGPRYMPFEWSTKDLTRELSTLWRKKEELRWFTVFGRLLTYCQKHCFRKTGAIAYEHDCKYCPFSSWFVCTFSTRIREEDKGVVLFTEKSPPWNKSKAFPFSAHFRERILHFNWWTLEVPLM